MIRVSFLFGIVLLAAGRLNMTVELAELSKASMAELRGGFDGYCQAMTNPGNGPGTCTYCEVGWNNLEPPQRVAVTCTPDPNEGTCGLWETGTF